MNNLPVSGSKDKTQSCKLYLLKMVRKTVFYSQLNSGTYIPANSYAFDVIGLIGGTPINLFEPFE